MPTLRKRAKTGVIAAIIAVNAVILAGCSSGDEELNTKAPPPSNPNATPEAAVNKKMPPAPPAMGAPGPAAQKR